MRLPAGRRRFGRVVAALAAAALAACGNTADDAAAPGASRTPASGFVDRAVETGLDFEHVNGMTGAWHDAEIFGGGVALADVDNDGDLDALLVQSGPLVEPAAGPSSSRPGHRLYRNDLAAGVDGDLPRFTDVTAGSGIAAAAYGMGVAAGDVDNDGWVDLYLTNLGPNQLLRNDGDGTFTDVTAASGAGDPGWSVSASFLDYDLDGWLDLYVGNYLAYDVGADVDCVGPTGAPDYCAPTAYRPQADRLYRNDGDGTFTDVTADALVGGDVGPALGVVATDVDDDGWPDVYVANDGAANILWTNQRDGTFINRGLVSGAGLDAAGQPEASMGVDAGDGDGDGDDDLFLTHWAGQKNTLYVRTSPGLFEDRSAAAGLAGPSLPWTGFGTGWFDADLDGWLDLVVANGAVIAGETPTAAAPFPLDERNQLYRNLGDGTFADVTASAGPGFALSEVSRGLAFGDVDNDGDVDLLVGNNNGRARLLLNTPPPGRHWVGLRLLAASGRDAVGARVAVTDADGRALWRRVRMDGSYASASDPRVHVGLGAQAGPVDVHVRWPGGDEETWSGLTSDTWHTLREGGRP